MIGWMTLSAFALAGQAAQPAETLIPAPPSIAGVIEQSDPRDSAGRLYDEYAIELQSGQNVRLSVEPQRTAARNLTPMLQVLGASETPIRSSPEVVAQGEVSLVFRPRAAGTYRIRIVARDYGRGRYRLQIREDRPRRAFGAVIGGAVAPAREPEGLPMPATSSPRSRFIICPGHPRCPRR